MESLRDVKRVMEREIEKGSCPLQFEWLKFGEKPFHFIESEERLNEVLFYLLRLGEYSGYTVHLVGNNVYMDLDMMCRKIQFKRTRTGVERSEIYRKIQRYKNKLKPDYAGRVCLETVQCVFRLPEEEAEKYRMMYEGQETYAFPMSNKYILGLFTHCEAARKTVVEDGVKYTHLAEEEQKKVDINPITAQRTGTLESYLPQVEEYLEGVRQVREQEKESAEVTLTVSECGEFHNLGECYENIPTVDEAIAIWKQIPSERMNGIPAIGINILGRGAEPFEDYEIDVLSGKRIDLGVLDYVPDIKNNPQAMEVITELVAKLPDMEIDGVMSEEMEARVWELRMPDLPQEEQLAVELDRLSYDYDTVLYHDSTRNMTENVSELAESIKQGDTGHLTTWLADIISEGAVPEEIKRATELLEKLAEYKPLAKIEEAEEQNYNMIDNVLNNGVGEKAQKEENKRMEEKSAARVSLKTRLAEKKAQVEGQSKEHDVQENEKKSQREM